MKLDRLLVGATIIVVLYLYTNAIFSFFSPGEQRELLRFFILAGPIAILFFLFPRFALIVLAILVYTVDWLADWVKIVPKEFTWFIDLILIIYLIRFFLLFPRLHTRKTPAVEKWIWVILAFALFSAIINQISPTTTLIGLRVSLKYLLLYVILYSFDFSEKFNKGLIYLQFAIALIQIPVVLIEFKLVPVKSYDIITGTFGRGGTGILPIFLLGWIGFLIAKMLEERRLRLKYFIIIILFCIPPVLGESKAFFFTLMLLIVFMMRSEWRKRLGLTVAIAVFGALLFVGADYVLVKTGYWKEGRNPVTYITRIDEVIEKDLEEPVGIYFGRLYRIKHSLRFATANPRAFFFGYGPGTATASFFTAYESPTVRYFKTWGISSDRMTFPWMIVEYGIVGTLLFFIPLFLLYRRSQILYRSDRETYRILASGFQGLTFVYIFNLFITAVVQSDQIGYFYWVIAVFITQLSYIEEKRQTAVPPEQTPKIPEPVLS